MLKKLTLGAALVAAAAFITPASAAPPVAQISVAAESAGDGLVQQVHWRHRHRHYRHRHYYGGYYYPYYYNYYPRYYYGYRYGHRHHHHHHHHRYRY
jgi:opacity protein-like surface antigen